MFKLLGIRLHSPKGQNLPGSDKMAGLPHCQKAAMKVAKNEAKVKSATGHQAILNALETLKIVQYSARKAPLTRYCVTQKNTISAKLIFRARLTSASEGTILAWPRESNVKSYWN